MKLIRLEPQKRLISVSTTQFNMFPNLEESAQCSSIYVFGSSGKERSEIMFINGIVPNLGIEVGVSTPINSTLTALVLNRKPNLGNNKVNVGSFITSEKETYGIFSDGYAQSVTDEFIFEYNSLRDVLEKILFH